MITCFIGISNSGKSTKARSLLESFGRQNAVIVNRDKIRELLFGFTESDVSGYYHLPEFGTLEKEVSRYQDNLIKTALRANKNVIIDNTNLKMRYLNEYRKYGVIVDYVPVEVTLDVAMERNNRRTRQVEPTVIIEQHRQFENLKKSFDFSSYVPSEWHKPSYNQNLKDCYVFDIDGTLALHDGRSPYDWSRVLEDTVNHNIGLIYGDLSAITTNNDDKLAMIICSGRDEVCRDDTEFWLDRERFYYDELHMRPLNNNEADWIIKERMWVDISSRYNIICMFDDRDQVVDHARRLGFTVAQVNYGDF